MLFRNQNRLVMLIRRFRRLYSSTNSVILKEKLPAMAYQPEHVERGKYEHWEKSGLFQPDTVHGKNNFVMVLPPPNVTGKLHLGHALGCTIQDVILRRKRALGHNVLWVPGTDHAGIATQNVVEKYLKTTKNLDRRSMSRSVFVDEVWKWKNKYGSTINQQLKRLGCSLDWSRHSFTMDPQHTRAVHTAFIDLFDKGLIYRAEGLVNWCNSLKSTVSDIEVDKKEITEPTYIKIPGRATPVKFGQMYSFVYKIFGSNEDITVSTTMPETMLGDVAIAVHPEDERYKHLYGQSAFHPFRQCTIPIIFDEFVDPSFGTGAVKITPAHSKVDYEVAKRFQLSTFQVIDENSKMINSGDFTGLDRYQCREKIVAKLADFGFLKNIQPHKMSLPVCSRTGDIIDYLPKEQWYLSCQHLNDRAKQVVKDGTLKIMPEKFLKNWDDWTEDNRDWCISRQLWWGHQVPAYKCSVAETVVWLAAYNEMHAKTKAARYLRHEPNYIQVERDQDVLDTWFSSAIYPFASLGWPDKKDDKFYPLNLMVTGHDILGFWVHRMVMLGLELTNKIPFKQVLLHGIICDSKGAKMSKSKGNVIDPMDVIEGISLAGLKQKAEKMRDAGTLTAEEFQKAADYHKSNFSSTSGIPECGTDALRFTLLSNDVKSHFVNFDVHICHSNKLFCNKIWQSTKYVQLVCAALPPATADISIKSEDLTRFDRWILHRLAVMVATCNKFMDSYDFHLATKAIRNFLYNEFCDVYLEATKPGFQGEDPKMKYAHAHTLSVILHTAMRCLNPFMIYLTDEILPKIPTFKHNVIFNYSDEDRHYRTFPKYENFERWEDDALAERVSKIMSIASLVRELKGLCGIHNKIKPNIRVKTSDNNFKLDVIDSVPVLMHLARCHTVHFDDVKHNSYIRSSLDKSTEVWVEILGADLQNTVRNAKERLMNKIDKIEKSIKKLEDKLQSPKYIEKVSESTREVDKATLLQKKEALNRLNIDLERLSFQKLQSTQENL